MLCPFQNILIVKYLEILIVLFLLLKNDDFNDIGKNSAVKILINLKNYENDIQALEVIKKIKGQGRCLNMSGEGMKSFAFNITIKK